MPLYAARQPAGTAYLTGSYVYNTTLVFVETEKIAKTGPFPAEKAPLAGCTAR